MNIQKLKIHNFRSISMLDLSLGTENRVVCFVGENGSAKTSVLSLIAEAIVSQSKLKFPDFESHSGKRYRLMSNSEINSDSSFYSVELHYSNFENRSYQFKKLVGRKKGLPATEYQEVIQGVSLTREYYSEFSTLSRLEANQDYLVSHIFLIRPSTRYEKDGFEVSEARSQTPAYSVGERYNEEMPYPLTVSHIGESIQSIILDMILDATIGYEDAAHAFRLITHILDKITGKEFGQLQVSQSPYRQVVSSNYGPIKSLSQGELDLLVTVSSILSRQLFHFKQYTKDQKKELGFNTLLDTPGIVLIDEVDLHLHPRAQESYIKTLISIFPNIQFIITTHSPFVVRGLPKHSKVVNLPSGRVFEENFEAMDIDSITNIIFGYDGSFSEAIKNKLGQFKNALVLEEPNVQLLQQLYGELSSSDSAKEELLLYLASYADEALINTVKGEGDAQSR
ncbi:AAA family ATPase [Vibrio parahaemolyticus]|uniref:AAA family ATPase n=2 Tax=Vibrio parahaemolyticus TaxID=670 RepID=UPI0003ED8D89|nr:AAA family ATPase [Vibrio parahaemolyticus]AHJ01823.1 Putative ATP binding protein SugR [Vibrio parahaemolyticus UCM-V493]EGQ8505631.1 AAA family ATPase [Vibrio parahaemolyticus]EHH1058252.1 AAA family ATPase [Vibrio parahaemolyticus]EHH2506577.1 AAA family ATPase [Vibrio parahaemolyticus]EHK9086598.1 AAA family ATPase [Vibrio parahaemolyticus]